MDSGNLLQLQSFAPVGISTSLLMWGIASSLFLFVGPAVIATLSLFFEDQRLDRGRRPAIRPVLEFRKPPASKKPQHKRAA